MTYVPRFEKGSAEALLAVLDSLTQQSSEIPSSSTEDDFDVDLDLLPLDDIRLQWENSHGEDSPRVPSFCFSQYA